MKASESSTQIILRLEKLIRESEGRLSPADASAATGYSLDEVNSGLARLIELYRAKVTADPASGKLMFIFRYPLMKRGSKTFREQLTAFGNAAYKLFKIIYKAAIGVILVFYTIIFVVILIALMFSNKDRDNDRNGNAGGAMIAGIFRALLEGFSWYAWTRPYHYEADDYGYRYKEFDREKNKGSNFIKSVFSFVLGPERPAFDPLGDAREALAYIRTKAATLSASRIIELSGGDFDIAEEKLAEYAVKFNGELNADEEGTVIARFYDMEKSGGLPEGKIEYYADEVEAPYELTGNPSSRNGAIIAMNLFNLVMSLAVINSSAFSLQDGTSFELPAAAIALLGYFPFFFSLSFFLIPLMRYPFIKAKQKQRTENIIRKSLVRAILARKGKAAEKEELIRLAELPAEYERQAETLLNKLVPELRGDIYLDPQGRALIYFDRIEKELSAG